MNEQFIDRVIGVLLEMRLDEIEYDEQGNIKHDPEALQRVYNQRRRTATLHLYDRPDSVPLPPGVKRRRKKTPPPPPAG